MPLERRGISRRRLLPTALLAAALMPRAALAQSTGDAPGRDRTFMLAESARYVDVVDSFDAGSTFSFRLGAGYLYTHRTATIERELRTSDPMTGQGTVQFGRVGDYVENTHTFLVNGQIGLYHDLALTFGVPIVLSNTREIRSLSDAGPLEGNALTRDGWSQNGQPTSLFNTPFSSPTRSGIDQLRVGLAWSILSQHRSRANPTWTVRFEWRPPVGSDLHACSASPQPGAVACPAPSSVPSQPPAGTTNATTAATRPTSAGGPGISRGLHGIFFQTALSRRFGFVEPYASLDMLAEFPSRDTPFRYLDTPYGQLANFPPLQASFVVGAEIIPWENRETWQRLVIDLRARGTYRSQGRDYSPLYDALGSSSSRPLNAPGCPSNVRNPDGSCQPGREVYFDGLTTVQSYMAFAGQLTVGIQPTKAVRIDLGAGLTWVAPHLITATDACNPGETVPAEHPEWRGGCVNDSAPDPTHRAVIDQAGGRFRTNNEVLFDFSAAVTFTPRFF